MTFARGLTSLKQDCKSPTVITLSSTCSAVRRGAWGQVWVCVGSWGQRGAQSREWEVRHPARMITRASVLIMFLMHLLQTPLELSKRKLNMGRKELGMKNAAKDKWGNFWWQRGIGGEGFRQRCDVRWDCSTNQGNVLLYVGAVGQVGENGVHVLYVGDADCQISEPGQRPQFVLILTRKKIHRHKVQYVPVHSAESTPPSDVWADRGVDSQLIGWGRLVVQRSDNGDGAPGAVYGEEGRGRLEGEEDAASSSLVWICGIHHEHWSAHRRVLQDTFQQTRMLTVLMKCRQTDKANLNAWFPHRRDFYIGNTNEVRVV